MVQEVQKKNGKNIVPQSSPRYIQYRMPAPSSSGIMIFNMAFPVFIFVGKGTNKRAKMQKKNKFFMMIAERKQRITCWLNDNNAYFLTSALRHKTRACAYIVGKEKKNPHFPHFPHLKV